MTKQALFRGATVGASCWLALLSLLACDPEFPQDDDSAGDDGMQPDDGGAESGMDPGDDGIPPDDGGMDPGMESGPDDGGCGCDEPPEPPPCDPPIDPCIASYEECLQYAEDPIVCEDILAMCWPDPGPWPEPEPDPCWEEYEACNAEFGPMAPECDAVLEQCWPQPEPEPEPDPCFDAYLVCLDAGVDPAQCESDLLLCWCGPEDPMCGGGGEGGQPDEPGDDPDGDPGGMDPDQP